MSNKKRTQFNVKPGMVWLHDFVGKLEKYYIWSSYNREKATEKITPIMALSILPAPFI
jgi:hypothetical protein